MVIQCTQHFVTIYTADSDSMEIQSTLLGYHVLGLHKMNNIPGAPFTNISFNPSIGK